MALTGRPLLVTLVLVVLAAPALIIWTWSRVRGNRWLMLTQRFALVLTAQLSALLLASVALNDYGEFFSSWPQAYGAFFGGTPHTHLGNGGLGNLGTYGAVAAPVRPRTVSAVRVTASHTLPPGLASTGWSTPAQYVSRGALATMRLVGPTSGLANTVAVYLPPAYFAGYRSLPVVEAITGYPSTYLSWTRKLSLQNRLAAGIRAHTMGQLVVVMAPAGLPYPLDSECTDAPGGPLAFTYFNRDIPKVITRVLHLHAAGYGAIGYSTGGYCALKLGMLDPQRFTAAASMSGYFHAQPGPLSPPMFGGSIALQQANDLQWRLTHLKPPRTSALIMTGMQEGGRDGWVPNSTFLNAVRAPMHAQRFLVPVDFGHSYRTWAQEVAPALVWVSRTLGAVRRSGGVGSAPFSRRGRVAPRRHYYNAAAPPAAQTGATSKRSKRHRAGVRNPHHAAQPTRRSQLRVLPRY